jgi:hypothetical protein
MKTKFKRSKRNLKGGVWGRLVQSAITPIILLGLRHNLTKKYHKKKYK